MHLTVVVADFFPESESLAASAQYLPRLEGLETVLRYGRSLRCATDWRAWLAQDLGRADLAAAAPAQVAAAALAASRVPRVAPWFAAPVHLLAGIDHLRLHPAGLLRLEESVALRFAGNFATVFGDSGWQLQSLAGGFLLQGLAAAPVPARAPRDPAHWLGVNIAPALATGSTAPTLRAATSEIEMWLHEHPLNLQRARRGELAVNSLWLWGGEPAGAAPSTREHGKVRPPPVAQLHANDGFVAGLCVHCGLEAPRMTMAFAQLAGAALAAHIVVVSAAAIDRHDAPLLRIDRDWLLPALAALRSAQVSQLRVHAGGRLITLRAAALRRFWRRPRPWWQEWWAGPA